MPISDYETGIHFHTIGLSLAVCENDEEVRGWLDAANLAWWQAQQARIADHERLCEDVRLAVEEERTGRRPLCVGYVEQHSREIVIVPLTPSAV